MAFDAKDPADQKILSDAVAEVTDEKNRLASNRDTILEEKRLATAELKKFGDLDPEKVRIIMKNINSSEEARLISEGKHDEVWDNRSAAMQQKHQSDLAAKDTRITELEKSEVRAVTSLSQLKIGTVLSTAAIAAEVLPSAIDDVLLLGGTVFSMDAEGNVVVKDENGSIILGADAKSPLQPAEWLKGLQDKKGHWWAASSGVNATGKLPGSAEQMRLFNNLPFDAKLAEARRMQS